MSEGSGEAVHERQARNRGREKMRKTEREKGRRKNKPVEKREKTEELEEVGLERDAPLLS